MSTRPARSGRTARPGRPGRPGHPGRDDSVWQWIWYGVSAGLLAIILGIGIVAIALPRLAGAIPLTVLTDSMKPDLPPGTMLVVRPLSQDEMHTVSVGDVISYQPYPNDPMLISHRVVATASRDDGQFDFTTKGDANGFVDPPVRQVQVRARLWYSVPLLGWVNDAINSGGHRSWIIPTVAGLLFAYLGYTVVATAVESVRKKRAASADRSSPA
ncbi:hypothetical protein GCM10022286_19530 [Gryllotalpicola daejeonensis]|uniref:Signal peptidase I n=1 Tax=Gryllotalpicola daejeonensis TaxID=993087 RepID=A0ABP7ZKJ6_9MICO